MATQVVKGDYFDAAFELLARDGYGGLKLAAVCRVLRVTTGSFYNYFENWKDFTDQLLRHWRVERTAQLIELANSEADPIRRLDILRVYAVSLPHRAEAAIRVWSTISPEVGIVQAAVDKQRLAVVYDAMSEVFTDPTEATLHAKWGIFLLVGFEQLESGEDKFALDWSLSQLVAILKTHRALQD